MMRFKPAMAALIVSVGLVSLGLTHFASASEAGEEVQIRIPQQNDWLDLPALRQNPISEEQARLATQYGHWVPADAPHDTSVERILANPAFYLSSEHEATSQRVIVETILEKLNEHKPDEAWKLCLALRWLSPRVDLLAPVCAGVHEQVRMMSAPIPAYPDSEARQFRVDTFMGSAALKKSNDEYLNNPYSAQLLANLVVELDQSGQHALAERLMPELYQIDSKAMWFELKVGKTRPLIEIARRTESCNSLTH